MDKKRTKELKNELEKLVERYNTEMNKWEEVRLLSRKTECTLRRMRLTRERLIVNEDIGAKEKDRKLKCIEADIRGVEFELEEYRIAVEEVDIVCDELRNSINRIEHELEN